MRPVRTYMKAFGVVTFCIAATAGHAALIDANGGVATIGSGASATPGDGPSIIAAPDDATDDAAHNRGIQAFDEQQFYTLTDSLSVDGGTIAAGTTVSSHMIFLNSGPGNNGTLIEHGAGNNQNAVTFTFDGDVLGVMSARNGAMEIASSFLGADGTTYPDATFSARGMEGNPLSGGRRNDWYSFTDNEISLGMRVTEPGDWIRVITAAPSQVPVPASVVLLGTALAGFGAAGMRRRRKNG
ncbi:VPLPA-CTERM sorting domain-containing protein [Rhodobacteraceae bacterium F11138]|nr:VPLPA-CTERM sorting domain-containing protein [Rhodobacteraceae bacterium F11138]